VLLNSRHASDRTQLPTGTIRPVSSASGMNSSGRTSPRVTFDTPMAERVQARQSMKLDLEAALGRGELRLVYQRLTAIVLSSGQADASRHASDRTQLPTGTIRPVSSNGCRRASR
jgi:hypothetical protein